MSKSLIALAEPCLRGNEREYLDECLRSNYVSSIGPFVERFEREFAAYVGSSYAVACSSGTAALHVALRVLGVGAGDEVFLPSFTFVASANAVLYQQGTPTFVDSERTTWNMDPALVTAEIRRRRRAGARLPKVIEVVHILGHPADIEEIVEVCRDNNIALLEDAAEALGARYMGGALDGRHVGTIGQIGCFSFNGNKVITTGSGGMLVTDDPSLARRAKHLTTQARLPGLAYRHDEVGFNYRLSNVSAAIGVAQLEQLDDFLAAKREIAAIYDSAFRDVTELAIPPDEAWAERSAWLYSVRMANQASAARAIDQLAAEEIAARPVWPPLHHLPMFEGTMLIGNGSVSEAVAATAISLPSSVALDAKDQQRVIERLFDIVAEEA
jgi:dTDP-4-amino-4,6-dideoxygalactose transaminase